MKTLFALLLMAMPIAISAQKLDHIWVIGDSNEPGVTTHGGMIIDFNQVPRKVTFNYREANMSVCNASICDTSGQLLFYTNGCDIFGADDKVLDNGETLNPGGYHDIVCDQVKRGYYAGYPGIMILPQPGQPSRYYVFHKRVKESNTDPYVNQLLYSVVEREPDGLLMVTEKNVEVMGDALADGEMAAVKHANGTDWWVITPRRNSNEFYCFLFTQEGVVDTLKQTIGEPAPAEEEGSGQATFSHDGSTMARFYPQHSLMLYHFDRATGQFSDYRTVNIDFGNHLAFDGGCYFSPNGRYLYVTALIRVYQFDLWASDISASQTLVGEWDGFKDPIAVTFGSCQLGPDCKIYVVSADMRYYHIIHDPDKAGLACHFEQRGLVLPTPSGASIPYFPNYRLGPVGNPGVPCSPTVSVGAGPVREVEAVLVWPNPASDQLIVDYQLSTDAEYRISLYNVYGQEVLSQVLPERSGQLKLPVVSLTNGMYWHRVWNGQSSFSTGKILIQH